ncbi:hypothetical protein [Litoreibacter meonggei]|uniref:hypothetical protein n=1 Tax=Litoreibacter meonggei TaxID=1049199 RepID=UPI0011C4A735|nr:hypothetical protein [Litoreibacter meonggei]
MNETPEPTGLPDQLVTQSVDEVLEDLTVMARELTAQVRREWRRVIADQSVAPDFKTKLKSDLQHLLNTSRDAEGKLDEYRRKRAGRAAEYAVDLGAARLEIRRRLDRIRDGRDPRGVS